jgi:hypothetical protein
LNPENGTNRLAQNVGEKLPITCGIKIQNSAILSNFTAEA